MSASFFSEQPARRCQLLWLCPTDRRARRLSRFQYHRLWSKGFAST
ncbi:hypothetical protein F5984_19545 [Rudanella paleaurantiibacter]|uniref:Uncharacterized protein n=1 Tax=Rudanella paleaurantiibacter TaxID=2614655 RepID=A0A7J5TVL4_9BACT|nr:hypothetical protein F5984_19545 [Rudanella paleaurantiibacter]